ncbi:hypothetical protein HPB51_005683 [Rhipicephalus microplus]|uniref:Uncharacterized protein n=1 Tax=Rhipicephalus microplus TaxID=6941 RepID=A0A9J6EYI5_RHIMP|nr:hypothetical protein HPB51_005683 [Rhipicephalus microplus]
MGTSGGGSVPYRPREPNTRISRKESKTPASHMHLPSFLAAVSSKPPTKSSSPNTATRVQKNETSGTNSGTGQGSSGGGGKSKAAGGGNMTARRFNNGGGVRESDMLGAKPKKLPRMNNMTFTKSSERSSGNSSYNSGNKAFSRTPPFRNSPRVYSAIALKDFNSPSKQDNGRGAATDYKPMLSVSREAPPKEQRSARQERRVKSGLAWAKRRQDVSARRVRHLRQRAFEIGMANAMRAPGQRPPQFAAFLAAAVIGLTRLPKRRPSLPSVEFAAGT